MPTVLIVYGTSHGQTRKIARRIGEHLIARGIRVEAQDVREHRAQLASRPSALFSVCLAVLNTTPEAKAEVAGMLPKFEKETGWRPPTSAVFAGALPYTKYNFFLRWVMKRIATMAGRDTDTSRDYEYTAWDEVRFFADRFADQVQPRPQPEARAPAP